jgi:hypothetical protein
MCGLPVEHQGGEFAGLFVRGEIDIMGRRDLVVAVAEVNL